MDVDVPVILVGFPNGTARELDQRLEPEEIDHRMTDLNQPLPPNPRLDVFAHIPLQGEDFENPIVPTAHYNVQPAPATVVSGIAERVDRWAIDGNAAAHEDRSSEHEGRALERYLAKALPSAGIPIDPRTPSLVMINGDAFLDANDTWRYTLPNGYLGPVEVFGEKEPLLIADTSRLGIGANVTEMKTLAVNATHYRLLQGPVYPIAPNTCHAVTVITAYHPASIPEIHPGFEDIPDLVDPAKIESTFEDLWGPASTVHVDFKTLRLPVDDPAIDAISRTGFWGFEAHRTWISANWEDYWSPHEGCEPYVTFAVQTDAGSAPSFIPGLAMYDDDVGHRIALVLLSTHLRLFSDPASPISGADPTTEGYPLLMDLYVHETGHVFGLRHPHQIRTPNGYGENTTFETVYSGVSYGADGRVNEFGAIEETNTRRNQAGAVVVEAIDQYLRGTDAFDAAMAAMAENDWQEVIEILEPHLVHDPATSSSLDPYLPRLPRLPGPAG